MRCFEGWKERFRGTMPRCCLRLRASGDAMVVLLSG